MSVDRTISHGRTLAATLMTDEATVSRPGASTLNTTTGLLTKSDSTTIHAGPCRVRAAGRQNESRIQHGERLTTIVRCTVWFPWDTPAIAIDDVIRVDSCTDELLAGRCLRVVSTTYRSHLHFREVSTEIVD